MQLPNRRSHRLPRFDYSQPGAYFLTINAYHNAHIFGRIENGIMRLSPLGRIVDEAWHNMPNRFPWIALDAFQIMPNHVHAIVWIRHSDETPNGAAGATGNRRTGESHSPLRDSPRRSRPNGTSKTLGSIVRGFKIPVTQWARQTAGIRTVWQRDYFDRIIRSQQSLERIRRYIRDNPAKWQRDQDLRQGEDRS